MLVTGEAICLTAGELTPPPIKHIRRGIGAGYSLLSLTGALVTALHCHSVTATPPTGQRTVLSPPTFENRPQVAGQSSTTREGGALVQNGSTSEADLKPLIDKSSMVYSRHALVSIQESPNYYFTAIGAA